MYVKEFIKTKFIVAEYLETIVNKRLLVCQQLIVKLRVKFVKRKDRREEGETQRQREHTLDAIPFQNKQHSCNVEEK